MTARHAPQDMTVTAWPALMTTDLACAYTQMSEASFRFTAAKFGVSPVDTGLAMTRWAKIDLDGLIDRLPRRGAQMPADPANTEDPGAAALARAKARLHAKG
jgi:hypothetical protein